MEFSNFLAFRCAPTVAVVCLTAACSGKDDETPPTPPGKADWTMLGYDVGSTYNNTAETKLSVKTAPKLTKAWEYDAQGSVTSTPVITGGRAYFMSSTAFTALELSTGNEVWTNPNVIGSSSPAYAAGVLYVNDGAGILHALNAKDGSERWQFKTDDDPSIIGFSSAVLTQDLVLVGGSTLEELTGAAATFRGFVVAVNKKDGKLAWKKYTVEDPGRGVTLWSTPSADEASGIAYAATGNNHGPPVTDTSDSFLAIPLKDGGDFLWKNQILANDAWSLASLTAGPDSDFGANPIVFDAGGKKLVAGGNKGGDFWVMDRVTGKLITQPPRHLGPNSASMGGVFVNGAWDGKHLLVACNQATSTGDGSETDLMGATPATLFALDPLTLDVAWERQVAGPVLGFISVANGVGLFGKNKTLQAFNTETGEKLFEFETEATIATAPSVSNGYVVFGSGMSWPSGGGTAGTKYYALKVP